MTNEEDLGIKSKDKWAYLWGNKTADRIMTVMLNWTLLLLLPFIAIPFVLIINSDEGSLKKILLTGEENLL